MADAAPPDADVFDTVVVLSGKDQSPLQSGDGDSKKTTRRNPAVGQTPAHPPRDGRVPLGLGDQMAQQGVGAKEAQADVGGLGEVLQHRRVGEPF